ncbi:MAG: D-aminoacyl-tRNA deacylase, partial [Candidatus Caldatribacterium sp.]|nr:D-aminoacyl-tRNA deacylase [Candidatus Caldatribacterium sp.]
CVSQFTLYGDCRRGLRPSFDEAAPPDMARYYYEELIRRLRNEGVPVVSGIFGAFMAVELVNDGPVTILLESKERRRR